jgi:dethiobiotin synthetase
VKSGLPGTVLREYGNDGNASEQMSMARGFFVTGTDTGVGKTLVCAALLHAFAARGVSAVGMKPIVAGAVEVDGRWIYEDVEALRAASSVAAPDALINQYAFRAPIAPHIAAEREGVTIDVELIERAYAKLGALAEAIIVEGVGGFKVPLGPRVDTADLARRLNLPTILVVGMRLGCLNHALLTQAAIDAAGLPLAGWVANTLDARMPMFDENLTALKERIGAPLLGVVPSMPQPEPQSVAELLDLSRLIRLIP